MSDDPTNSKSLIEHKGLISIVVPVYNVERYISATMESLAIQDDDNFEVIVVDEGGPQDSSIAIVESFADRFRKLRIHRQENRGLGGARNSGLCIAEGEFVTFVDGDDIIAKNYASALRRKQVLGDYDIVSGDMHLISVDGEHLPARKKKAVPELVPGLEQYEEVLGAFSLSVACGRLYRRSLLLKTGIDFPENVPHEDLFFTHKILRLASSTAQITDQIYYWRQRPGSLGKSLTPAHINMLPRLRSDTEEFLRSVSANPYDYVFAARRNLIFICRFRDMLNQTNSIYGAEFWRMINESRVDIEKDIALLESAAFADQSILKKAGALIRDSEKSVNDQKDVAIVKKQSVDIAFLPLRAYHLRDCLHVLEALQQAELTVKIIETDDYRQGKNEVRTAAKALNADIIPFADFVKSVTKVRVVVMWNDWDPLMRLVASKCHIANAVTVGFVEGIQDYQDVDTGRLRYPYRRSKHVILPGEFDRRYFQQNDQKIHVGEILRIGTLWQNRLINVPKSGKPMALINSNFAYGVLEEHRDHWVTEAVNACLAAGFDPLISRHPFDTGSLFPEFITAEPFDTAIRSCEVSIHRFASGILESLASGIPVIYFNPHGEKVDKFASPEGAYLLSNTCTDLEQILKQRRYFWNEKKAFDFLALHAGLSGEQLAAGSKVAHVLKTILDTTLPSDGNLGKYLADIPSSDQPEQLKMKALEIPPLYGAASVAEWKQHISETPKSTTSRYIKLVLSLQSRSPALFRLVQTNIWLIKAAWQHKMITLLLLASFAGIFSLPLISSDFYMWRAGIWSAGAILAAATVIGSIANISNRRLRRKEAEKQTAAIEQLRKEMRLTCMNVHRLSHHIDRKIQTKV